MSAAPKDPADPLRTAGRAARAALRRRLALVACLGCAWVLNLTQFEARYHMVFHGLDAAALALSHPLVGLTAAALLGVAYREIERRWLASLRFDALRRIGRGTTLVAFGLFHRTLVPFRQMVNDAGYQDMLSESRMLMAAGAFLIVRELVRARPAAD